MVISVYRGRRGYAERLLKGREFHPCPRRQRVLLVFCAATSVSMAATLPEFAVFSPAMKLKRLVKAGVVRCCR